MDDYPPRINVGYNDNRAQLALKPLLESLEQRGYEIIEYMESDFDKRPDGAPVKIDFNYEYGATDDASVLNGLIRDWATETDLRMEPSIILIENDGEVETRLYSAGFDD